MPPIWSLSLSGSYTIVLAGHFWLVGLVLYIPVSPGPGRSI